MISDTSIHENQEQALSAYLDSLMGVADPEASPFAVAASQPAANDALENSEQPQRYYTLLIQGVRLALPAERIGKLAPFTDCAGEGASALHLGYIEFSGRLVPVLAAGELIMPGRVQPIPYQLIVVDKAGQFALACHGSDAEIEVLSSDVRWKTDHTSRRWLAGTAIAQRCALLDTDELGRLAAAENAQ